MNEVRGLGLIPSPVDKRDILMSSILPELSIPQHYEVSNVTLVRNQGSEGTCVGFACAVGMKEWQEQKERTEQIELSPRYLYQKCKEIDGHPGEGTSIRIALNILLDKGVCEERYWPYIEHDSSNSKPGADENAAKFRIKAYASLDSIQTMKRSLYVNGPFVMGVPVYNNWWVSEVGSTGKIPMPGNSELVGGHAICVVGYDDNTLLFKFKNSWDKTWGDNGFGYLPYDFVELRDSGGFKFCEAWSATDLIDDPRSIVSAKEKALDQLNIEYTEEAKIKFH